jgi:hypothetical protein
MNNDYFSPGYTPQPQQYPVSQDEMYANLIQEERVKNVIQQISPDNQLVEIELRLRGYKKNLISGTWEKIDPNAPEPHPLLITRIISYLSSLLNQSTPLGNLQEIQINRLMKLIIEYLSDDLDNNAELYGLGYRRIIKIKTIFGKTIDIVHFENDYNERTRVAHIVLNSIFMVMTRALNGTEARRMWGSLSMNESLNQQPQKGGFKEALKFWK